MFWIALAGPLSNIFLAIVGAVSMRFLVEYGAAFSFAKALVNILNVFIVTNLFLAIFNLLPLNPLDGGKVLARFLPASINYKLEQNEHITSMILMALVLTGMLRVLSVPVFWTHDLLIRSIVGGIL
jgi:Zn-dependent protease